MRNQEIVFRVEVRDDLVPVVTEISTDSAIFRIRFSRPLNPLSLRRGATRIMRPDGGGVSFTTLVSLDSKELILVPAATGGQLDLVLENLKRATADEYRCKCGQGNHDENSKLLRPQRNPEYKNSSERFPRRFRFTSTSASRRTTLIERRLEATSEEVNRWVTRNALGSVDPGGWFVYFR
jgi:hypothetical protein